MHPPTQESPLHAICEHIHHSWNTLTRDLGDALTAARDSKVDHERLEPWPVYVSPREDREAIMARLQTCLSAEALQRLSLRELPPDWRDITDHGLLYLPGKYVVPGGRFNEMHGWDSHFITLGLLRSGRIDLAKSMVDQQLYQVEHYGMVLNANRTYFLTRSHPPFLGQTVLAVYRATGDREWLAAAFPLVVRYYYYWTVQPHFIPGVGLSRYFDLGDGPAPEVNSSEVDEHGLTHYDRVCQFFQNRPAEESAGIIDLQNCTLTDQSWRADRAMRESGFDPGFRFGPFNLETLSYVPVCLNTLLWRMERDIAAIQKICDTTTTRSLWLERADQRRELIDRFLWNPEKQTYSDYHIGRSERSSYDFATSFWPLWAGLATMEQAAGVVATLPRFESAGGLLCSPDPSGCQWDAPFSWAPLVWMAVAGLHRYGYGEDARRLARKFVQLVLDEFNRTGHLYEKYDAVRRTSDIVGTLTYGYTSNETGFGWTNACFLEMLHYLGKDVFPD